MRVLVLGPVRVERGGCDVPLHGGRERAAIAALALVGPGGGSTQRLVDLVWGEDAPPTAGRTLASYLSRLRASLGPELIATTRGWHRLTGLEVDLWEFDRLRERAARVPAGAHADLLDAVALWRAPVPASDATLDGATTDLAALSRSRLDTTEALLRHLEPAAAVEVAERLASDDPYREGAWAALAEALGRLGRHAEGLEALRRARRVLGEDLGLDPSPGLRALELSLLTHDGAARQPAQVGVPLPRPLGELIGRDALADKVVALLGRHRLVTLVGPGGVGKTRLALAVAHEFAARTAVTTHFAALAEASSVPAVENVLLTSVGVEELVGRPPVIAATAPQRASLRTSRWAQRFEQHPGLVVVDSCEHVASATADLVEGGLRETARLQVLATSRVALGLPGEVVVPVPPLDLSAAGTSPSAGARLFLTHADTVTDTSGWGPSHLARVDELCRSVDGIPLAIELLARQLRYTGLTSIRPDVESGFGAVLDASAALVGAPARRAFHTLGVLRGPVPFEAAAAIVGDASAVAELVDASLLTSTDGIVRMYEPVRQHAVRGLDDAARRWARASVARELTALAEEAEPHLVGPDEVIWFERMTLVHPDVREVLQWAHADDDARTVGRLAVAVGYLWLLGWGVQEGSLWLDRAVGSAPDERLRARLLRWSSLMSLRLGDLERAAADATTAAGMARESGDGRLEGQALHVLGLARRRDDARAQEVRDLLTRSFELRRAAGDTAGAAMSFGALADFDVVQGNLDAAAERYAVGLALVRTSGSARHELAYLHSMAELAVLRGDADEAERLVAQASPLASATSDSWHAALLDLVALTAARRRRSTDEQLRLARSALASGLAQTDPVVLLDIVDGIAGTVLDGGDAVEARRLLLASRRLREDRSLPIAAARRRRRDADLERALQAAGGIPDAGGPLDLGWLTAAAGEALH